MKLAICLGAAMFIVSTLGKPLRRIAAPQAKRYWAVAAITTGLGLALLVILSDRAAVIIAAAIATATVLYGWQRRKEAQLRRTRGQLVAEFLGHLAANIEAGTPLTSACRRAAQHLPAHTPPAIREDVAALVHGTRHGPSVTPELARLSALWGVSTRRGVPIAALLHAAREELDATIRHRNATQAALAGPKTTALILCALPLAGIALGASMGARPIAFLTSPGLGSACLVAGTTLVSAGFLLSNTIIERATQ